MAQAAEARVETIGQPADPMPRPTRSGGRYQGNRERVAVWYHQIEADGSVPPATSIVPTGMTILGNCEGAGDVYVDGEVKGAVRVTGLAVIGRNGVVDGSIVARDVVVAGSVSGELVVESSLELADTAHVVADVRAGFIRMEEGAFLMGAVEIGRDRAPRHSGESTVRDHDPDPSTHVSDFDPPPVEHVRLHVRVDPVGYTRASPIEVVRP